MKLIAVCALTLTCAACAVIPWPMGQTNAPIPSDAAPAPQTTTQSATQSTTQSATQSTTKTNVPASRRVADCSEHEAIIRRAKHEANEWKEYAEKLEKLLNIPKGAKP